MKNEPRSGCKSKRRASQSGFFKPFWAALWFCFFFCNRLRRRLPAHEETQETGPVSIVGHLHVDGYFTRDLVFVFLSEADSYWQRRRFCTCALTDRLHMRCLDRRHRARFKWAVIPQNASDDTRLRCVPPNTCGSSLRRSRHDHFLWKSRRIFDLASRQALNVGCIPGQCYFVSWLYRSRLCGSAAMAIEMQPNRCFVREAQVRQCRRRSYP